MTERKVPELEAERELRRKAEELARRKASVVVELPESLPPEAVRRLAHELQVHQIELEMQNEELRQTQLELETSKARYFELYDLAPVGYLSLGDQWVIRQANLTLAGLLGVARDALVRQPLSHFVFRDDQDRLYLYLKRIQEPGAPRTCEVRLQRAEDGPLWVRLETAAAKDVAGALAWHVAVSDIHERKQLEDAQSFLLQCGCLKPGEDFFDRLAHYLATSLGIDLVRIDRLEEDRLNARTLAVYFDGKFQDNVTYALKDTPCGELVGKTICCFPRDVRGLFPKDSVLQDMAAESYVGTTLWSFDGKPIGLIAIIGRKPLEARHRADEVLKLVSLRAAAELERREAEQHLKASEAQFRTLFEAAYEARVVVAPPDWRFAMVNPAAVALFGAQDQAELLANMPWGCSPEMQPDGRDSAEAGRELIDVALRQGSHSFDWTHRKLRGEPFAARVMLTRMEFGGQVVVHGTVSDETERNLRQSSQAQGERLATMGRLAASLAHELNNPLQVVLHNVDSLAQELARLAEHASRWRWEQAGGAGEPAPEEAAERPEPALLQDAYERAREALAATLRIKEVTERLGAFARVERREATRIDPVRALRSALKLAAHEIGCRARLVEELLPVPAVLASEGKLAHALLNLLLNAAQAIDEGEVEHNRITVRSWADGSNIFLEIADTGQGIAPENLGRIFEPFFTTKGAGRGSGLGLSLARSLVSSFGGELEVESELGKGSKFRLRLPAAGGCETEVERPSGAQALGGLHRSDGSQPAGAEAPFAVRGRILVVDDEEMIRRTMVRVLDPDHEVVTGASGREGQAILERDTAFDVILCDLMMPDMSGMDLHRWMAERNPDVARRFVFVSGGAFTERAEQYLAMAGNPQVSKPIGTTALRRYVADLVLEARNGPRT